MGSCIWSQNISQYMRSTSNMMNSKDNFTWIDFQSHSEGHSDILSHHCMTVREDNRVRILSLAEKSLKLSWLYSHCSEKRPLLGRAQDSPPIATSPLVTSLHSHLCSLTTVTQARARWWQQCTSGLTCQV